MTGINVGHRWEKSERAQARMNKRSNARVHLNQYSLSLLLFISDQPFSSLQHQTEDVVMTRSSASLPDVVPFQRNRSVSLPEVQPLRQFDERTMGRTLRRISDEFEFYHRESRVCSTSESWGGLMLIIAFRTGTRHCWKYITMEQTNSELCKEV